MVLQVPSDSFSSVAILLWMDLIFFNCKCSLETTHTLLSPVSPSPGQLGWSWKLNSRVIKEWILSSLTCPSPFQCCAGVSGSTGPQQEEQHVMGFGFSYLWCVKPHPWPWSKLQRQQSSHQKPSLCPRILIFSVFPALAGLIPQTSAMFCVADPEGVKESF